MGIEQIPAQGTEKNEEQDIEDRIQNIEVAIENIKPESLWVRIKDLIVGYIVAIILFMISWYFIGAWAIAVLLIIAPISYFYTKYIYKPPFTAVMLIGHKSDDINTPIILDVWGLPDQVMNQINLQGLPTPVVSPWGPTYMAEKLTFDEKNNLTGITFAWPHNNELNFIDKHALFHYLREENYILAKAHNWTKMLLHAMALRMGFHYATYMIKLVGDEKIEMGLKGVEDEKQIISHIEEADKQLLEIRRKYGIKDIVDKEEAELVPEG